ncbi:GtrA family protein [Planobispora longispora]|uniref:GtrA/DPMS transmembrane domain-containing protein n=1 Tax=Planobispora longispora TaxID=28887 RepID=A0A8J3W4U2_9ACTN|nr:GtrA family protein [Planobispora longispora]BFE86351.1 hypothetical protein GCM10020093_089520 [Planobispora longispora]GIH75753.1 hypothetical protein Plo01_21820 [Planobispora longispora]
MTEVEVRTASRGDSGIRRRTPVSVLHDQRITYLIGGGLTALVYLGLLALALPILEDSVPYLLVVATCHFATVLIVYPWYRLAVFRVTCGSWIEGYARFYVVCLGFLAASMVGLPLLVGIFDIPVVFAQFCIMAGGAFLSYAINRSWTFRNRASV